MTGEQEYMEAYRAGRKEYRTCVLQGRFPYLPVLDEILSRTENVTERKVGLVHVPLEFVVGTSTAGRTQSFADNFMPILGPKTEFGTKWAHLADSQMEEGIRDPIEVYEFMNRYYVVEGNKRVSVLKHFGAVNIAANVTRKLPPYNENDEDIKRYYELLQFIEATGLYSMEFSHTGTAKQLLALVGRPTPWDAQTKDDFSKVTFLFSKAYDFQGVGKLRITLADALTAFMNIYGFEEMLHMPEEVYNANIQKVWNEFVVMTEPDRVNLVLDTKGLDERKNLFANLMPRGGKKYTIAFLYPKAAEDSDWIYGHELGRKYLEQQYPDQFTTIRVDNVGTTNIEQVLEDVIAQGAKIVFGVAPQILKGSLKVAIEHPEVKILNCSLNTPHKYIRTYYARMYEAKYVSGLIAGALADNDRVAYVADYPIYGMIANINAFALGVASVNPRAKIYLEWSTKKGYNLNDFLRNNNIQYVSNQDLITPKEPSREFGLYRYVDGKLENLAMPVWNWGAFYEKMINSIVAGSYNAQEEDKAINYWWGMSAGVIDLFCSDHVPVGVRKLAEHIRDDIATGDFNPFTGEITSQDGTLRNEKDEVMTPQEIMQMDWLVDNIIGEIPTGEMLVDAARPVVELKGVEDK